MASFFSKKEPTPAELLKDVKKEVRVGTRDLDKDLRDLTRTEQEIVVSIKKRAAVASGPDDKILRAFANQLVGIRAQKDKVLAAKAQLSTMQSKATALKSQLAVANSMTAVGAVMGKMNSQQTASKTMAGLREFQKQSVMSDLQAELMDDALCDAFDGDGVEEEADALTNQVLAELGLETASAMQSAPVGRGIKGATPEAGKKQEEEEEQDLAAQLPDLMARVNAL